MKLDKIGGYRAKLHVEQAPGEARPRYFLQMIGSAACFETFEIDERMAQKVRSLHEQGAVTIDIGLYLEDE